MTAKLLDNNTTVHVFGNEAACEVYSKDCIRDRSISHDEALICRITFESTRPEDTIWRPLIEEFVYEMGALFLKERHAVRIFPQWAP